MSWCTKRSHNPGPPSSFRTDRRAMSTSRWISPGVQGSLPTGEHWSVKYYLTCDHITDPVRCSLSPSPGGPAWSLPMCCPCPLTRGPPGIWRRRQNTSDKQNIICCVVVAHEIILSDPHVQTDLNHL